MKQWKLGKGAFIYVGFKTNKQEMVGARLKCEFNLKNDCYFLFFKKKSNRMNHQNWIFVFPK